MHSTFYDTILYEEWFDTTFLKLLHAARFGTDSEFWKYVRMEDEEIYSFPVFSRLFLKWIQEELQEIYSSDLKLNRAPMLKRLAAMNVEAAHR